MLSQWEVDKMPEELDRCVKKLIEEGYTEKQAWAICKAAIESKLQTEYEMKKKILTGQLIVDKKEDKKGEN